MRGDRLGRGRRSVTCARGAVPEDHDSPSLYCPLTHDQRLHHLHGRDAGLVTEAVQQPEALLATIALHALLWAALITGIYRNLRSGMRFVHTVLRPVARKGRERQTTVSNSVSRRDPGTGNYRKEKHTV